MTLSIVITTFNRQNVLAALLEKLHEQGDKDFQVVVAIDGSTDGTHRMLENARPNFDLKWVDTKCPGYGLAVARNLGILASDGSAVAIIDDDSFPAPDFVAEHKRSVKSGVITGGPRIPADAGNVRMVRKMEQLLKIPAMNPLTIPELRSKWPQASLIENNICMLRDDFIAIGLFNERLKLYGFIGQEFFARAEHLGFKYQVNPAAIIEHHGELAGDNGFDSGKKTKQARWAELLRPSLMTPEHFRAQVRWAGAVAQGLDSPLPSFWPGAVLALPWRAFKRLARRTRNKVRQWSAAEP